MFIEQRAVSRKTPLDGKLEISAAAALRLQTLGPNFTVRANGREARAQLVELTCTCAKGGGDGTHAHHFVESDALRSLEPGTDVRLAIDETRPGSLSVEPSAIGG